MTLNLIALNIECCYAECRNFYYYAECRYAECRYDKCRCDKRRYAKCRYDACRGAFLYFSEAYTIKHFYGRK